MTDDEDSKTRSGEARRANRQRPDRAPEATVDLGSDASQDAPHADLDWPSPAPSPARYGRYELLGELGSGGMGVVYQAHDPELDRLVALKVIGRSQRRLGAIARDRLVREARAMAKLAHPNVIAIYDVGSVGDEAFVAMELVHGSTLKHWLRRTPRPLEEIVEVFTQAANGLIAAHTAGLVHRDFKPSNVIVGDDGRVRVLDFGLARLVDAGAEPEANRSANGGSPLAALTRTGAIAGTPAYMAIEQCFGEKVDERTDQFSFCVTLYEALYGSLPFTATSVEERAAAISAGDLSPPTTEREVPPAMRDAVLRGLSADPAQRHPSMRALTAELVRSPGSRGRRRKLVIAAALTLAVAIGSLVAVEQLRERPPARGGATGSLSANSERLRMQMVDNASPLMARLSAHVEEDHEATRLGVSSEVLVWRAEAGGEPFSEHYLMASDRTELEAYLKELWRRRSDLAVEPGHEILLGRQDEDWRTYYVWARVELDGSSIREATVQHDADGGDPVVLVRFDDDGAVRLAATTGQNTGRRLATIVNGRVSSAFVLQGPILGGAFTLTVDRADRQAMERQAAELARDLDPQR